ncbi:GNAT family N-acetyltransferase [Paraburkholderia graminis]|uniref:GNAT family N-acetyltransferase n=1 Tax=Paraburkholderia graminis TaxID=60548 RepID=UPI0038B9C941
MQPVFETPRLILRPRTLADTDECLAMDRDPLVTRFVDGPWSDAQKHRAFVEARTLGPYPAGMGYWTIGSRNDAADFLGWVLLIPADAVGPEIEIGWRLPRKAWGAGIATEAATAVLQHAFATLRLAEVVAEIDPLNLASIRVAERLGLVRRGDVVGHGRKMVRYASMEKL